VQAASTHSSKECAETAQHCRQHAFTLMSRIGCSHHPVIACSTLREGECMLPAIWRSFSTHLWGHTSRQGPSPQQLPSCCVCCTLLLLSLLLTCPITLHPAAFSATTATAISTGTAAAAAAAALVPLQVSRPSKYHQDWGVLLGPDLVPCCCILLLRLTHTPCCCCCCNTCR
jgi:hypothetical protein